MSNKPMIRKMRRHNPVAKSLNDDRFHARVVKARKGKGSYSRKSRGRT